MKNITNNDLRIKQYSMNVLEYNIDKLQKKTLLCTQVLTAEFCVKYILDLDIETGSEDSYIYDFVYILNRQPHITENGLKNAYSKVYGEN